MTEIDPFAREPAPETTANPENELSAELAAELAEVDVQTEATGARERRLSAGIAIATPPDPIWQVLTDYEALSEFIPNLETTRRLEHPQGGIRLEQVGADRLFRLNFRARLVLDLEEEPLAREIRFQMVEGDFKRFEGCWQLEPVSGADRSETYLRYSLTVCPPRAMPVRLIEGRLRRNLALNLVAIRQRVCDRHAGASTEGRKQ